MPYTADMVSLYQDHHVDFVATYLALPAAAITEMSFSRDMTLLPVSEECVDELSKTEQYRENLANV